MLKLGDTQPSLRTLDAHKWAKSKTATGMRVASTDLKKSINIDWLPMAAKELHISADINDYVINEVPIVAVDFPNRNLDEFSYEEMLKFNVAQGKLAYQTFIGKPTHEEHVNEDPTKAKGVHFDSYMERNAAGIWHVVVLAGWDRTKDAKLANDILTGKRSGFSMGAFVDYTVCSYPDCGASSSTGQIMCEHSKAGSTKGMITQDGHLMYERCAGVNFIEMSAVGDPAQHDAIQRWQQPWMVSARTASVTDWLPSRRMK